MKTNGFSLLGALGFSLLFYKQDFGFNTLLFAILSIILLLTLRPSVFKHRETWWTGLAYVLSALFVFTTDAILAIVTNGIAFIIFIGSIQAAKNSIFVKALNGLYNLSLGSIHFFFSKKETPETQKANKDAVRGGFILLTFILTVLFVVLFSWLYSKANPVFKGWLDKIDLSFINFGWLCFTLMGFFLIKNLLAPVSLDTLTEAEKELPKTITPSKKGINLEFLRKEHFLGCALIGALNILILLFLLTDITYLWQNPFENSTTLSKAVHEGINALIGSILIAITLLLLLFRGDLNFYKQNIILKKLSFIWIGLNILLILLTAYKNGLYVSGYGLTYKRIGVFIYLLLCISGLISSAIKISHMKNVYYLIRINVAIGFVILLLISSFNWDRSITRYNLSQLEQPDFSYLTSLSLANSNLIYAFAKAKPALLQSHPDITRRYKAYQKQHQKVTWQSQTWYDWTTFQITEE